MARSSEAFVFSVYEQRGDRVPVRAGRLETDRPAGTAGYRFLTWVTTPRRIGTLPHGELLLFYTCFIEYRATPDSEREQFQADLFNLLILFAHGAASNWDVVGNATQQWKDYTHEIAAHKHLGERQVHDVREDMLPTRKMLRQFCKADLLAFYVHQYEENGPNTYVSKEHIVESEFWRFPYSRALTADVREELLLEGFLDGPFEGDALFPDKKSRAEAMVADSIKVLHRHLSAIGEREGWLSVADGVPVSASEASRMISTEPTVFVIHGHDEAKRRELVELLKERLHLRVVVMQDRPGRSRTFIEKFEQEAKPCNAAIAVVTPDDMIQVDHGSYMQPRPNVVYELGWFAGRYGRDRTLMVVKEGTTVELWSNPVDRVMIRRPLL